VLKLLIVHIVLSQKNFFGKLKPRGIHARHYSQEDMCIIGKEEDPDTNLAFCPAHPATAVNDAEVPSLTE